MPHVCTGFFFVIIGLQRFFWGVFLKFLYKYGGVGGKVLVTGGVSI